MNYKKAFTLIELLVTVAIVGVLSSVVIGNISKARSVARDNAMSNQLRNLQNSLELYYIDNGEYPAGTYNSSIATSIAGLESLLGFKDGGLSPCFPTSFSCPRRFFYRSLRLGTQGSRNLTAEQSKCWENHYYIFMYFDNPVSDPQPVEDFPCGGAGAYGDSDPTEFCAMMFPPEYVPESYRLDCENDMIRQGRENYVYVIK